MPDCLSASEYILDNFKPSDPIAILLRNRSTGEVAQRIASAEKIAARDFQERLTNRNQAGFDIYVGMNALKDAAHSRTKRDIHEIRHAYLDLDYRGPEALKAIQNSDEVPKPNFVFGHFSGQAPGCVESRRGNASRSGRPTAGYGARVWRGHRGDRRLPRAPSSRIRQ